MLRVFKPLLAGFLLVTCASSPGSAGIFDGGGLGGLLPGGGNPLAPPLPLPPISPVPPLGGLLPFPGAPFQPPGFLPPSVNIPRCAEALARGAAPGLIGGALLGFPPTVLGPGVLLPPFGPPPTQILSDCLSADGQRVPAQPPLEPIKPSISAAPPAAPLTLAMLAARKPVDVIFYIFYECRVDWHHYCDGVDYLALLDGAGVPLKDWQVCKPLFTLAGKSGATTGPVFNPSKWYTQDPILPANFRRLQLVIHANGNNIPPFPRSPSEGALIRLEQVGLRLIAQDASFEERVAADCDFPASP
jgi:hypothetical protein